jgi:hypothetical protein
VSLQYDSNPGQGYLLEYDLNSNTVLKGYNTSQCFSMWADPADASGQTPICLALEPTCDGGAQCTELRRINRSDGTDDLVSSFLPNFAPYTVSCFDTKRGLIYSTFGPLSGGPGNVIAAIDPRTGTVVSNATFPLNIAYIEFEYDPVTDRVYSVVESPQGTFFGTVEPSTGVATPLSSNAYFNSTYWNQWNTISTVAPQIGVFFSTAFHYAIPNPPSDPILHVRSGEVCEAVPVLALRRSTLRCSWWATALLTEPSFTTLSSRTVSIDIAIAKARCLGVALVMAWPLIMLIRLAAFCEILWLPKP